MFVSRSAVTFDSFLSLACAFALQILIIGGLSIPLPAGANVFTVNQTNDGTDAFPGDGDCWTGGFVVVGGFGIPECSLRAAIEEANALAGADSVAFASGLSVDAFGTIVIAISSALPPVTDSLTIDGTTAPTYDGLSANPVPVIELSGEGSGPGTSGDGLKFGENADGSVVRGLSITRFIGDGISLDGADDVLIDGNHIGMRRGSEARINWDNGIRIQATSSGTIVGKSFDPVAGFIGTGNVISANQTAGISVAGPNTRIAGNRIGTDRFGNLVSDGISQYGNRAFGISVGGEFASNAEIGLVRQLQGGTVVVSGNAISGNSIAGISVATSSTSPSNVLIRGNSIGIGLDGITALGNDDGSGIVLSNHIEGVQIGELGEGRNVIGGHTEHGIVIGGGPGFGASLTKVIGNRVGRTADGNAILLDAKRGIFVNGGSDNEIAYNEVSAEQYGIYLDGDNNHVYANYVGTNEAGLDLGNSSSSAHGIMDSGDFNEIGHDAGLGNVLGFSWTGISTDLDSSNSLIQGNFIGVDSSRRDLGNKWGIWLTGANALVGGSVTGQGNTIGFCDNSGVLLFSAASGNKILGNFIGTNEAGDSFGNGDNGIQVEDAYFNTIGSDVSTPASFVLRRRNWIANNGDAGIALSKQLPQQPLDSISNAMRGNAFHDNGGLAIDLEPSNPSGNDPEDADHGHNNLQNAPVIEGSSTSFDSGSGLLTVQYRVDSTEANSAYPLIIDFYEVALDGEEPGQWLGQDVYLGNEAQKERAVSFVPEAPVPALFEIVAIATDDENNTSEAGNLVVVPEPTFGVGLMIGVGALTACGRRQGGWLR